MGLRKCSSRSNILETFSFAFRSPKLQIACILKGLLYRHRTVVASLLGANPQMGNPKTHYFLVLRKNWRPYSVSLKSFHTLSAIWTLTSRSHSTHLFFLDSLPHLFRRLSVTFAGPLFLLDNSFPQDPFFFHHFCRSHSDPVKYVTNRVGSPARPR